MLLELLEFAFATLLILSAITQIIVPAFRSTPLFPFFRREKHLASQLERVNEEVLEEALRQKIARRQEKAARMRRQSGGHSEAAGTVPPSEKAKIVPPTYPEEKEKRS